LAQFLDGKRMNRTWAGLLQGPQWSRCHNQTWSRPSRHVIHDDSCMDKVHFTFSAHSHTAVPCPFSDKARSSWTSLFPLVPSGMAQGKAQEKGTIGKKRGFRDRNKLNVVLRSSLKLPSTSLHQSITSSSAKKLWNTCCLHDRSFTVENICQSVNFSFLPNILSVACPKSPCNVLSLRIDRGSVSDSGNTPAHRGQQETHLCCRAWSVDFLHDWCILMLDIGLMNWCGNHRE
jgi:hypothetical protein